MKLHDLKERGADNKTITGEALKIIDETVQSLIKQRDIGKAEIEEYKLGIQLIDEQLLDFEKKEVWINKIKSNISSLEKNNVECSNNIKELNGIRDCIQKEGAVDETIFSVLDEIDSINISEDINYEENVILSNIENEIENKNIKSMESYLWQHFYVQSEEVHGLAEKGIEMISEYKFKNHSLRQKARKEINLCKKIRNELHFTQRNPQRSSMWNEICDTIRNEENKFLQPNKRLRLGIEKLDEKLKKYYDQLDEIEYDLNAMIAENDSYLVSRKEKLPVPPRSSSLPDRNLELKGVKKVSNLKSPKEVQIEVARQRDFPNNYYKSYKNNNSLGRRIESNTDLNIGNVNQGNRTPNNRM